MKEPPSGLSEALAPSRLPDWWRTQAATMKSFGADAQAVTLERCADELAQAFRRQAGALITLREAAVLTGFSADHLGRLVKRGKLANYGRSGRPLLRPADLPRKPSLVRTGPVPYDVAADARALAARRKGSI